MTVCAWAVGVGLSSGGVRPGRAHAPRRRARVCSHPRISANAAPGDEAVATAGAAEVNSSMKDGQTGAEIVARAAAGLRRPGGLLTDSVLETKWRAQRAQEATRAASRPAPPPPLRTPLPSAGSDWSQSDPYAAFSAFTRIAAPTAALGEGEDEMSAYSTNKAPRGRTAAPSPYSAGILARRMLRYFLAKRNLDEFLTFFSGEFDNYDQVREERARGVLPGEGGGHEHIHCSIVQPREGLLFARYYFNGDPSVVFRSRLYRVDVNDKSDRGIIEMRIFRLYEETEQELKRNSYNFAALEWEEADMYDWLQGCEVFWERYEPESVEADTGSRALDIDSGTRFVGYMKGGGCELFSREINAKICVMDDLLLTRQHLWVADRAFDEEGNFVYGNRKGIPYKMKRVNSDGPLAWTMTDAQPPEDYVP